MNTNEELVQLIQEGKTEYKEQLWIQCVDFVKYMANKHLVEYPDHCKWLFDDMVQQAYLHFDAAIQKHDNSRGKFLTYFEFYIKTAFAEVLYSRTEKQKHDPLNASVSLDIPLNDTDDLTLLETLIDTESEAYYRAWEDEEFWRSVGDLIDAAINETVDEQYRDFFRNMLKHGRTITGTLDMMGIDRNQINRYRYVVNKGERKIKKYIVKKAKQNRKQNPVLDDVLNDMIGYNTGIGAWRRNAYTSSVEMDVIRRNDRKITAAEMERMISF